MWTLDTRVDVTPAGRYVAALRREDRRLGDLLHPGKDCTDNRVRQSAVKAEAAADTLRGALRDELERCGALPLGERDEEPEPTEADRIRFYREDEGARNASDGRGECCD